MLNHDGLKVWHQKFFGNKAKEIFNWQLELSYLDGVYQLLHPLEISIQSKEMSFLQRTRLHYDIKATLDYEKVLYDLWFTPECASKKKRIDIIVYRELFSSHIFKENNVDEISKCLVDALAELRANIYEAKTKFKNFKGLSAWVCASVVKFTLDNLKFNFIKGAMEVVQRSEDWIVRKFASCCKSTWFVLAGSFWILGREYYLAHKYNKSLKSFGVQKILHNVLSQTICNEAKVNYYLNFAHSRYARVAIKISALTMELLLTLWFAAEMLEVDFALILYFVARQIFSEAGARLFYRYDSGLSNPFIKFVGKYVGQELFAYIIAPRFTFFNFTPRKKIDISEIKNAKKTLRFFCDDSSERPTKQQFTARFRYLAKITHPDSYKRMNKSSVDGSSSDEFSKITEAYEFFKEYYERYGEGQGVNLCWPSVINNLGASSLADARLRFAK